MRGMGRARRATVAGVIVAASLLTFGDGAGARADAPCSWVSYKLPIGSKETQACIRSKGSRPQSSGATVWHRRGVGGYFIEVGASVPVPV